MRLRGGGPRQGTLSDGRQRIRCEGWGRFAIQVQRMKIASSLWLLLWMALIAPAPATDYKRTEDVIYGRKFGTALTLDVFQPDKPNGCGIVFMVSGGFFSSHEAINAGSYRPFLERGYTVFAVVHGSQPKFTISEIEL